MKKLTLLLSILLFYVLSPTLTSAQNEARLISVRIAGGTCGSIIFVEVTFHNPGGVRTITTSIASPQGNDVIARTVSASVPTTLTQSFALNSSGILIANTYFRVNVSYSGDSRAYLFSCSNFELAPDGMVANPDYYNGIARNEVRDMFVTLNDRSPLPIESVRIIQAPVRGTAVVVGAKIVYTAGNTLGTDVIRYEVCNIKSFANPANCQMAFVIIALTNLPPDCASVGADSVYFWPPNQTTAPFLTGVIDPDGDPVAVQINTLNTNNTAGGNGIVYSVGFTATDSPPSPGIALSCTGTTLVQKDS